VLKSVIAGMMARCRLIAQSRGSDAYVDVGPPMVAGKSPRCMVVTQPTTSGPDEQTGGDVLESVGFMLSWYDETAADCWDALRDIEKSFKGSRPVLPEGANCRRVTLGGQTVVEDPDLTPEGRPVWRGLTRVTLLVQRSLTA